MKFVPFMRVLMPRPVSMWLSPIEFGVVAACLGFAMQIYLTAQMYRQLRELVYLHKPHY